MAASVGAGIKAKMDEAGDTPLSNEWVESTNNGGMVAKAWGKLGLYVASNDSGAWVTSGPFGGDGS